MMNVIRGEILNETVTLTAAKELHFNEKNSVPFSLVEEECQKAFKEGEEKGEAIGYTRALNDTKVLIDLLHTVSQKIIEQKKRLFDQLKPEIIEFAIALCEQVIRRELSNPEIMVKLIHTLLNVSAQHLQQDRLHIVLSPDDFIMLENHLIHIQYAKEEFKNVAFRADPLMKRGDCCIESPTGLLNYSISRELAGLQEKVLQ